MTGNFNLSSALRTEEDDWLREEYNHLFRDLWINLDHVLWVSKPENIRKASLKLFQLSVASEIGFLVP